MANPIMTQKALDGISSIITLEVLSNLQTFINQVTIISKQSKKIQDIINTISDNLDEKTQQSLTTILKRQNNEISIIKERTERNKLPKCSFTKKNGKTCDKACKSGHKKDDKDICDEHFSQIESYRDEKCVYADCGDWVKKNAAAINIEGDIEGVSYYNKFLCSKHHKKVNSQLQKLNNPCKFMVQSKDGDRMCGALAVSDERCKKHHGKDSKKKTDKKGSKKSDDKPEEDVVADTKNTKKSNDKPEEDVVADTKNTKKSNDKPEEDVAANTKNTKKGSKKSDDKPEEDVAETKNTKKGSKKSDDKLEIDVNFKGKRALNWISKKDEDDEDIFVDAHSGLVACEMGDEEESNKVVYAVWDVDNNTISPLTDDAKKYAKKLKLQISDDQ